MIDRQLPNHNLEPLIDIARKVDKIGYGNMTVTLRIHDGFIVDVTEQSFQRKRYSVQKESGDISKK